MSFGGFSTRQARNSSPGFVCKREGLRLKLRTPGGPRLRLRGFLHSSCRIFSNFRVFWWFFLVMASIFDFEIFLTLEFVLTLAFFLTFLWLYFENFLSLKPPPCPSRPFFCKSGSTLSTPPIWSLVMAWFGKDIWCKNIFWFWPRLECVFPSHPPAQWTPNEKSHGVYRRWGLA